MRKKPFVNHLVSELLACGETYASIASRIGVSSQAVYAWQTKRRRTSYANERFLIDILSTKKARMGV